MGVFLAISLVNAESLQFKTRVQQPKGQIWVKTQKSFAFACEFQVAWHVPNPQNGVQLERPPFAFAPKTRDQKIFKPPFGMDYGPPKLIYGE